MKLLCLLCVAALMAGFLPMPNLYYMVLRFIISIGAIAVLTIEIKRDVTLLGIAFLSILLIFNPIVPLHLHKKILWMPINLITTFLFLVYAYKNQLKEQ